MICCNEKITYVEDLTKPVIIDHYMIDNDLLIGPMDVTWICAIVNDDFLTVSSILNTENEREKHRLLNGVFKNVNIPKDKKKHIYMNEFSASNPWSLAVSHSSRQVIELFLSYDVDVFKVDNENNNALHKLVEFTFLNLEQEAKIIDTYEFLRQCLGSDTIMKLLMMENLNKLRPLELTAHLGTLSLFQAILETDNVYIKKEEIYGVNKLQYFDVTEYEAFHPNTRRNHSPANLLMCLDKSTISERNRERTKQAFHSQPLCAWLDANFRANYLYIIIWIAIRVTFALLLFIIDYQAIILTYSVDLDNFSIMSASNNQNITRVSSCSGIPLTPKAHFRMMILLSILSVFMIIYDIWDLGRMILIRKQNMEYISKTPRGKKSFILHVQFYRTIHFINCISTLGLLIIVWIFISGGPNLFNTYAFILVCVISVGSIWSLFYFIQIIPNVGYFVISIQRMVTNLVQFILIFCLFHLSFVYGFLKILNMSFLTGICPMYFTSIGESFYGLFMIMLNMVNLHQYNSPNETSLFILHIFYIFIVAILLINFLVAIFTSSYADVEETKDVIYRIQALSLAVVVENRIPEFMWPLSRWLQKRYFVVEGDKLYITRLVPLK